MAQWYRIADSRYPIPTTIIVEEGGEFSHDGWPLDKATVEEMIQRGELTEMDEAEVEAFLESHAI